MAAKENYMTPMTDKFMGTMGERRKEEPRSEGKM